MVALWLFVVMLCVTHCADAQLRKIPYEKLLEVANPKPVSEALRFEDDTVSFGTIDELSGVWKGRVKITNCGGDTLVVTSVRTTCGCLQAELSKRVLTPQESDELSLEYYPRGHAGDVRQRVYVYTNLSVDKPSAILQLRGNVTASADRSHDYRYERGALRLRQEQVRFVAGRREVVRVACMNGGADELRLGVDTMLLPTGFRGRFEPSTLASKQEGHLVVEFDPAKYKSGSTVGPEGLLRLYITGLPLPPRQRTIEIVVE